MASTHPAAAAASSKSSKSNEPENPAISYGVKPLLGGVVTGGVLRYMYPGQGFIVPGTSEATGLGTIGFLSGGAASYVAEKIHTWMNKDKKNAAKDQKLKDMKSVAASALSNAALLAAITSWLNNQAADDIGKGRLAVIGFTSEIVASFFQEILERSAKDRDASSLAADPKYKQSAFDHFVENYL